MKAWRSIRFRLALVSAAAVGIVGLSIGIASYVRLSRNLGESDADFARHEALEVAQIIASLTRPDEVRQRIADAQPKIFPEEGVEQLEVYDLEGRAVACLPPDASPVPWPAGFEQARAGHFPAAPVQPRPGHDSLQAALLVKYQHVPRWLVLSRVDRAKSEEALSDFRGSLLVFLPLAAGLAFLGSYGLVALTLRPVHQLVDDARRIADEGLGRRLVQPPAGSELAELVRLLNVMLARAEETVERLRRFAADASHELRTPLARMRGEAEIALRENRPEAASEALVSVMDEVDTLRRLVDGLLELSRGDTGGLRGAGAFDLAALTAELAAEATIVGETRGLVVTLERAPGPVPVKGSRDLLGRALWNLLDNALKHVPSGERLRVSIGAEARGARLVVEDSGPGIPPAAEARLFEPFFRADPARSGEGHGLGLALSRTIARRFGGDLVHERAEPRGARFVLTLPLAAA